MTKRCVICGTAFEAKRASALYCGGTCRKRAQRRAPAESVQVMTPEQVAVQIEATGLAAAVRIELELLGKQHTVEGVAALSMALRMESPSESGTAVAALCDRMLKAMGTLRATSAPVEDEVETARRKREEKRRAAAGKTAG